MTHAIPVFEALIAVDKDGVDFPSRAQLAYCLKDKKDAQPEDLQEAEKLLTWAIDHRSDNFAESWRYCELNRATCRVALGQGQTRSVAEEFNAILADLREAAKYKSIQEILDRQLKTKKPVNPSDENEKKLVDCLDKNTVTEQELFV